MRSHLVILSNGIIVIDIIFRRIVKIEITPVASSVLFAVIRKIIMKGWTELYILHILGSTQQFKLSVTIRHYWQMLFHMNVVVIGTKEFRRT